MVVKSATKKKLMDLGFSEAMSNTLAQDRKWDDVKDMSPDEIYEIIRHNLGLKVDSKKGDHGHWDYTNKVALWRKLGRLEIKVVKDDTGEVDTDRVYISVPYLSEEYQGMYNFRTGVLIPRHESFRGLGSLFSRNATIFDWHFVGPSNATTLPADVEDGYLTVMNQLQTPILTKILKKMESGYLFPVMFESINRADILTLWDEPPEDDEDFDGLGSLFG